MFLLTHVWILAAGLGCLSLLPQSPAPGLAHLSASDRAAALKAIQAAFQERYVFPEMRPAIIERLEQSRKDGRYDLDDPVIFAERITQDLEAVSHDLHLYLRTDPAAYAAAMAPPQSTEGMAAFRRHKAIREHHGLSELKVLPGNLRYLKITGFKWVQDETGSIYDEAMRFLKDGDAVIIDLRGNGGGSSAAVRYLVSHFLDEDVLEMTFHQGSEIPKQSRTLDHLPAGRLKGMPLWVLIDRYVASAAESFAYDVAQFKLGELVGSPTIGAANNNELLPIAPSFILSLSFGRPVHAVSQTNWEGVGVKPAIQTLPGQELDVAQSRALAFLAKNPAAMPEALADYAWAKVAVEARLHPVALDPAQLKALSGQYGNGEIAYREGSLWWDRSKRPSVRLLPLTEESLFAVEHLDILRLRLTGKTMEQLWMGEPAPRVIPKK
ncbi:MAG: S41 family peptidase [Acidobacteria bacterium]|nr:S41 family peptidase [Acidobacteriota bacterium]MBI3487740.1 S41 family peptidase [Acidobacteriota bacterium]